MSLQVWLPLNGDLHNQGLCNTTITNNGATIDNNGKIGKCYYFNGSSYLQTPSLTGIQSICFWIKMEKTNTVQVVFADYKSKLSFGFNASNQVIVSCVDKNIKMYTDTNFPNNIWTHIALVYNFDNSDVLLYINGVLQTTRFQTNNYFVHKTDNLIIGARNNSSITSYINGYINDFRMYDHHLSAKEVEEISKGLILHYKLDNNGFGNENYWGNGKPLRNNASSGELRITYARQNSAYASVPTFIPNEYIETKFLSTRTQVDNGVFQLQKLQRYTTTNSSMCPILEHLKTGEQFTISYELYVTSPIRVKFILIKILDGTTTTVQPSIDSVQISTLNTWTKISQSIEIPSSFDESNITTESLLGISISFYDILGTTSAGEVTIRVRNIKLEKGQVATDWTPARADFGHSSDNIIFDSSGYNNNGSVIGSLETITSSPRYNYAAHLESSSPTTNNNTGLSYIQTPLQISAPTQMTVCWWANPENGYNNSVGHGAWCTSANSGAPLDYNSTAFHHRDNRFDICLNSASTTSLSLAFNNYTKNEWHYYSVVYDGKNAILYKDGVETNRSSISSTIASLKSFTNLYIGFSKAGGVWRKTLGAYSDFRIYATALTAEQVKELYQTSTTVDKNSNIYARELVEI